MRKTFRKAIVALCMMAVPMAASAQSLVFHLAGGEKTTIQLPATFTVTPTGNKLVVDAGGNVVELAKDEVMCVTYRDAKGDVNGDQHVDVADVSTVVSLIIGAGGGDTPSSGDDENPPSSGNAPKDAEAVDLGLPSGTKWANMNVGAECPEDYGLFFAWGETTGYTSVAEGSPDSYGVYTMTDHSFDFANTKWCNGSHHTLTKYCNEASNGTVDNQLTLLLEDDAARANWGGEWSMPTYDDMRELLDNTTNEWTIQNGVNGRRFTAANGNSIFLPAAGYRRVASLCNQSVDGNYWSASVYPSYSYYARCLIFDSGSTGTNGSHRENGFSVRPVLRK